MRPGNQNNRNNNRQRSRGRRQNNSGNAANKVYDSNGPDVRVRGSAQTVADKYLQLAADAQSQGDRIKTESYFQYAEHYLRIVAANQAAKAQRQAEKEKAAEEHNARMQAKKEKAANELNKAKKSSDAVADVNGTDETETTAKNDDWGGHQPAFLQGDINSDAGNGAKVAKKPRRKPAKKKTTVASEGESATGLDAGAEATKPSDAQDVSAISAPDQA